MASIDVSINDIIWALSSHEKQELMDELWDDGIEPTDMDNDNVFTGAETNTEVELQKVLGNIWKNRLFINSDDLITLNKFANKGVYGV